jgi:hypothetical protein
MDKQGCTWRRIAGTWAWWRCCLSTRLQSISRSVFRVSGFGFRQQAWVKGGGNAQGCGLARTGEADARKGGREWCA